MVTVIKIASEFNTSSLADTYHGYGRASASCTTEADVERLQVRCRMRIWGSG